MPRAKKLEALINSALMVSQVELLSLTTAEAALDAQERAIKAQRAVLAQQKKDVMAKLQGGATVEDGDYTAAIVPTTGKCAPKWKEEYVAHMTGEHGMDAALAENQVQVKYPPKTGTELVVSHK